MRSVFQLLFVWLVSCGWLFAQTTPSLPLLHNAESGGITGFAVKVGQRIIGVADATYVTDRTFDWVLAGQKTGWKFDSKRILRPVSLGYYPLVENGPPPPVVFYTPAFSLADGEPLILHAENGVTAQGYFMVRDYKTKSYSSDQGFRLLHVRVPDLPQRKEEPHFKVVTKKDGRQVVGVILGNVSYRDPAETRHGVFEPVLVGHPAFLDLPKSNATKIFGHAVSSAAASALARWICPDFFAIQVGDNVKPWQAAWRVPPDATYFTMKGGDMRLCYDTALVGTMAVSAADTKKGKVHDVQFSDGHRANPSKHDGVGFVNALFDTFGDPAEASYFGPKPDDGVMLRFHTSPTTDFIVRIEERGPARSALRPTGDSFRIIEQRGWAQEAKLATTRKDVLDALALLGRP